MIDDGWLNSYKLATSVDAILMSKVVVAVRRLFMIKQFVAFFLWLHSDNFFAQQNNIRI